MVTREVIYDSGGGSSRVVRGGGWGDDVRNVRASVRVGDGPGDRYGVLGFRCVRSTTGMKEVIYSSDDKSVRVLRGGGWGSGVGLLRASVRVRYVPGYRNFDLGFRLVRKKP